MRLLLFRQRNFRNLALEAYRPPPGLSALVGANAQGKTSLLLGIHLALGGEVPLGLADLVRFGEEEAWLHAEVETELGAYRLEHRLGPGGREVLLNGKRVSLRALWELPGSVLVSPLDLEAVLGPKEERRAYLDRLIARFSRRYAALLSAYEKAQGAGIPLPYGALGENLLLDLDPHALPPGARLRVGEALLELSQVCPVCKSLSQFDLRLPKLLYGGRGVYARVLEGGVVRVGDPVLVLAPAR